MRQLEIDSQTTLAHILGELKTTEEDGLELTAVPGETTILDNPIHKAVIEKAAASLKKEVVLPASPIENAPGIESDDLGFVEGEDILSKAPIEDVHQMIQPTTAAPQTQNLTPKKKSLKIPAILKKKWVIISGVVAGFLLLLGLVFYLLPSAEINLVLGSETKDSQISLVGDTSYKEVDLKNKQIPLKAQEVTKDGTDQMTTTGKKTIGTPAKGRVTITNRKNVDKTFAAGTILTPVSTSSATFILDNDAPIPASQWPLGPDGTFGVNVTATTSGTGGNLPSGTSFKVGSALTDEVSARNDIAFSGGSSKLATVASSDDRDALKKQLVDKLTTTAKADLEKTTQDSLVPDGSSEVSIVSETYDPKAIDAESDSLKATIQIKIKTFLVNKNDLMKLLVNSLESSVKDFKVDENASKISAQQLEKTSDTTAKLLGKIKAVMRPEINQDEIRRNTTGKSLNEVKTYLDGNKNISSYKVVTSPSFFDFFNRMPFLGSRIKVNLSTN